MTRTFPLSRLARSPALLAATVFCAACTTSDLFVPPEVTETVVDNKVSVSGGFCAEGADDLEAFLKITLIIDRSNSMNVTDPLSRRADAARDLVMRFVDDPVTFRLRNGVEINVMSFFGNVVVHTRNADGLAGFSTDGPEILFATTQVTQTSANTGYDKALAQAFSILDQDMAKLSDKARNLSRYETIFVSDGMPFPDNCRGEPNSPSAAVAAVERMRALSTLHKVKHTFHSVYLTDPAVFELALSEAAFRGTNGRPCGSYDQRTDPRSGLSVGEATRELLRTMAIVGRGTFTQYDNGDSITFEGFEFANARRIYALSNFMVTNINAVPDMNRVIPDSDADGLPDAEERKLGTSPYITDSDGDGFSDGVEWRFRLSGFDPLDPTDARCDELGRADTDFDGLRDCEEGFLGTRRRSFDSDADGMPDWAEFAFGGNPGSATPLYDAQNDSDADGGDDADEIRWHTDPTRDDVGFRSKIAYDYRQRERPITTGRACYDFEVRNIALASTETAPANQERSGQVAPPGWNRIMLYFAQTPYDDPLSEPLYRLACVDARFVEDRDLKIPATGRIEVPSRRPSDTYRATDVLRPNGALCHASVSQDCGLDSRWCRFSDDGATCNCFDPPRFIDTDGDGLADSSPDPADGADYDGDGQPDPLPCPECANGQDDDGDGMTDFPHDPDCFDSSDTNEATVDECSDGIDNDDDGRIDWPADPGCANGKAPTEAPDPAVPPQCADGIDNDVDGATDYPNDPGCFAAVDDAEGQSLINPIPACGDGVDNDGDGLIDFGSDLGCADIRDLTEDGPAVCFFCERTVDLKPGQCDFGSGYCRSRSGMPNRPTPIGGCTANADCAPNICDTNTGRCISACSTNFDCRGAVCDPVTQACRPCLSDPDCNLMADGSIDPTGINVCDPKKGWCLSPAFNVTPCASDTECPAGPCDVDLGYCAVDPFYACTDDRDCAKGHLCSEERGFCLKKVFETDQCADDGDCVAGDCNEELGWCLPPAGSSQICNHSDECPFGNCLADGYCDQQTFVFPEQFRPEVDCIISR